MASCYRTNDLLGAHAVCQQQFQQQQQHHHVVQQQQQQQQPPQKDYSIPLFVDCSVEYELPKQAKPPVGVRVEPLLMIHPCHFRKMEIQTRSPFVNNMPNFKQRSSIKSSQESSKNVIVSTVAPAGYHQPSAKALDIQIQHHQKLQQQQQLKAVGHMTVGQQQQQQCSMAAGYQQHYQPDLPQRVHKVQKSSKDYALQSAYCDYNTRLTSHNQMLQLQTQVDQQQQQQSNVASYAPQSWNGYEMSTSRKPTQQMLAASDNYIIKKSNSNNTQCYSTTQVNSAAAQLKAAQGQVMYQQQQTNGVGKKDAMLSNGCDMYKNNNNLITNATTTTTTTTNKNINNNNNNLINHNNTSSNNNNSTTQCNRNYNNNNMPNKQYTDTSGGLWRHPTSSSSSTPSCPSSSSIASMAAITQQHQQQQQQQHLQQQNFQIPGDINMSSQALIKNYQQINRNNVINSAKYRQYLKSHRIHPYMMTGSCVNTTGFPQMASAFPHHQMQQVPCYNV